MSAGYPVYCAPQASANCYFDDGVYWVFQDDDWYASSRYYGPWRRVGREAVPLFVLRVPVRYYRQPPGYFRGWRDDAPPRWGDHWGRDWERSRPNWDRWDRRQAPAPAPLPTDQQKHPECRYPQGDAQRNIRGEQYRYQPHEPVMRQQYLRPAPRQQPREPEREPERGRSDDNRGNKPDGEGNQGRGKPDKEDKGGRGKP